MSDETHVERINPGDNPADAHLLTPDPVVPEVRGIKKLYMMLVRGVHFDRLYRAGETVELYDDEVGAHHQLIEQPVADVPALPAPVNTALDPDPLPGEPVPALPAPE